MFWLDYIKIKIVFPSKDYFENKKISPRGEEIIFST